MGYEDWADDVKAIGKHPERALSAVKVRQVTKPGRYADGNGLYLVVDPSGAKRWLLRIVVQGRRRDIGLGGAGLVSLAEAREGAFAFRKLARDGGDPLAERTRTQNIVPTFAEAAERVHAENAPTWKSEKHAAQWINTLRTYALPSLGAKPLDQIGTPDVLRVLSPIWLTKPETARRVRQRIHTVLDWAHASGYRTGENPVLGVTRGLPRQTAVKEHHAALPYDEVPTFIAALKSSSEGMVVKLAFEFLILTAARTSEVLEARWAEIDAGDDLWVVPATRMKAKREHRVPLSMAMKAVLNKARAFSADGPFIFPGRRMGKPLSNMALLMALRRLNTATTAHGFRSSFRDWAAETTTVPREVAEMALAHTVENRVEAAYRRGDLLQRRRELMQLWSDFTVGAFVSD